MAQTAPLSPSPPARRSVESYFTLDPLVLADRQRRTARGPGSAAFSLAVHLVLAVALIVVPLFLDESLPAPDAAIRAFFVTPAELAPPPPPPPPPPAAARKQVRRAQAAPRPVERTAEPEFVAPIVVPEDLPPPEEGLGLDDFFGGVEGGVEGGVPGGVVGGIVGGLPDAPPPPPKAVRVGGAIRAPELLKMVEPEYPDLARQARIKGIVIIEAHVNERGRVTSTRILRSVALLDRAALEAVRAWVYRPLLLNGIPTPFIVTVTVNFNLDPGRRSG